MTRYVRLGSSGIWHILRDGSHLVGWSPHETTECGRVVFDDSVAVEEAADVASDGVVCNACAAKVRQ